MGNSFFNIEGVLDMDPDQLGEGILELENAYANIEIEFRAVDDPRLKMFTFSTFSKDSPQLRELHKELFWRVPTYFDIPSDRTYRFIMNIYGDVGSPVEIAIYYVVMETPFAYMPKDAHPTTSEWEQFTKNLSYSINGEPKILPIESLAFYKKL